jgi:hypothetical protein
MCFERFCSLEAEFNYAAYSVFEDDSSATLAYNAEIVGKGRWNFKA